MEKDFEGTLKRVKEIGYDYVEFAGYFGKSAEEVKSLLDKYELTAISVHQAPALFVNEDKERCAVHFMAAPKLQKSCRLYNSKATRIPKSN